MKARHAIILVSAGLALGACDGDKRTTRIASDGDGGRGREAITRYGCGACHQIPGVRGTRGIVGPSLKGLGARPYLAGHLPNDRGNLVAWIRRPRVLDPKTIMPDLAVSERDAQDIAAFLVQR